MTTDVYPRENCIAPAMVFIVWTTDTTNGRGLAPDCVPIVAIPPLRRERRRTQGGHRRDGRGQGRCKKLKRACKNDCDTQMPTRPPCAGSRRRQCVKTTPLPGVWALLGARRTRSRRPSAAIATPATCARRPAVFAPRAPSRASAAAPKATKEVQERPVVFATTVGPAAVMRTCSLPSPPQGLIHDSSGVRLYMTSRK